MPQTQGTATEIHLSPTIDPTPKIPDVVFKPNQFVQKITVIMKENTPESYRFVVCDSTQVLGSGFGGSSRQAIDPPAVAATLEDRLNICSMSKTITATAVLATLQAKNLSPDALIAPFLPPDWKLSDEVKQLSFRDFMTHQTGFHWADGDNAPKQDASDYAGMKAIFEQKPFYPIKTTYDYRNINFAILRVILPYLDSYNRFTKKVTLMTAGAPIEQFLAQRYVDLVNQKVLAPSGVAPAGCNSHTIIPPAGPHGLPVPTSFYLPVLAYHYKKPSQKGIDIGDQTLYAGAEGWCLSVIDIAKVLQTVLYTEVILSEKSRGYMAIAGVGHGCGMNSDAPIAGSAVHSHGAWIPFEQGAPPDGAQLAGWYLCYEKPGLIVVALSNSGHDPEVVKTKGNWDVRVNQAFQEVYS